MQVLYRKTICILIGGSSIVRIAIFVGCDPHSGADNITFSDLPLGNTPIEPYAFGRPSWRRATFVIVVLLLRKEGEETRNNKRLICAVLYFERLKRDRAQPLSRCGRNGVTDRIYPERLDISKKNMTSRSDSLQDIFGPSDAKDGEAAPLPAGSSTATIDHQEFDDIFATGGDSAIRPPPQGAADKYNPEENLATTSSSSARSASEDIDNIFGGSSISAMATSSEDSGRGSRDGQKFQDKLVEKGAERIPEAAGGKSLEPGFERAGSAAAGGDKEFLDFLYENDGHTKRDPVSAQQSATPGGSNSESQGNGSSPALKGEVDNFLGDARDAATASRPLAAPGPDIQPGYVSLADGRGVNSISDDNAMSQSGVSPPESYLRKQRSGELAPLPENPGRALRELVMLPKSAVEGMDTTGKESKENGLSETVAENNSIGSVSTESAAATTTTTNPEAAINAVGLAEDVAYIRRLCAAAGGFLSPELRPAIWSLLLGLGRKPWDAGFDAWRVERRENPEMAATAATAAYKIDLRNDCLALARRLCEGGGRGDSCSNTVERDAETKEEHGGGGGEKDPEAIAIDIEEVLTFYCARRSEAYEPILCALVGPLFSMGLDPPEVSAMLHSLVGSLTLFLGRGLTLTVRDIAWTHSHRRLHHLCTYHDPELVQHLDRCFPGWEMPLPADSVSRAETSALDQEAAAMVDDLESSLAASLRKRRLSGKGNSLIRAEEAGGDEDEGAGCAKGKGLVEPSLLVAASAGLGANAPLASLLPLWDYLLVRHDKHFGYFLLLASLLRRREDLLAASGPQLRAILAEAVSPADMATRLVAPPGMETDADREEERSDPPPSPLLLWCSEAEALDLNTPESFRHHLALIGEIAEAEHEVTMRARAQREADKQTGDGVGAGYVMGLPEPVEAGPGEASPDKAASSTAQQTGGGGGGGNTPVGKDRSTPQGPRPSLLRMRSMMKNAGDKIAADFKSLKLTRATSSRELAPPPPTELSLPQLFLAVSAKEVLTRLAGRGDARSRLSEEADQSACDADVENSMEKKGGIQKEEGRGLALFRRREPLSYFVVDCRPKEQVKAGRFPTAFHLDPSSMDNPEEMAEKIMLDFEPLRGRAHVCLVGSGDGHLRARGSWVQTMGGKDDGAGAIGSQRAARDEYSYVNTCALFFVKRGFPFVSVLEGGFAAALELVLDTVDRGSGDLELSSGGLSGAIVDHDPSAFRLNVARKDGNPAASVGGGMGGLLFPLSPPLWARIGAADPSTHGGEEEEEDPLPSEETVAKDKTPLFPGSLSRSSKSVEDAGDDAKYSAREKVAPGEGEGGGNGSGTSGLFTAAGVFRGMHMNMGSVATMFKGSGATDSATPVAAAGPASSSDSTASQGAEEQPKPPTWAADTAADLAVKWGAAFGRLGTKGGTTTSGVAGAAGSKGYDNEEGGSGERVSSSSRKDSGFGSLFRKAQALKAADVAAAFADLRDGPKTTFSSAGGALGATKQQEFSSVKWSVSKEAGGGDVTTKGSVVLVEEEEEGGVFVIGDDGSEASETPDSDFEGFEGEHRPPSSGGARSTADKELALLEHRLSGQVKGATMVVDEFLRVPGAKVFTVTKHKVTYHDVDATPPTGNASPEPETEVETTSAAAAPVDENGSIKDAAEALSEEGKEGNAKAEGEKGSVDTAEAAAAVVAAEAPSPAVASKKVRVRAVTELERTVFLTRERILVLACPGGPKSPGLVKSNRHLTELQKMTFMRRDPTLVTLHYFSSPAPGSVAAVGEGGEGGGGATKRNVYRFVPQDKETFIRIIRGALQRFQS